MTPQLGNQIIPRWTTLAFWLIAVFVCWSIFGLSALINDSVLIKVSDAVISAYAIIHIGLAVGILRETGLRLCSVTLCLIGLAAGEGLIFRGLVIFCSLAFFGLRR